MIFEQLRNKALETKIDKQVKNGKNYIAVRLIQNMSQNERRKFIDKYFEEFSIGDVVDLVQGMDDELKKEIIEKHVAKLGQDMLFIVNTMNDEFKKKIIEEFANVLQKDAIIRIIGKMKSLVKKEMIEKYFGNLLNGNDIYNLAIKIENNDDEFKKYIIETYSEEFDSYSLVIIISRIHDNKLKIEMIEKYFDKVNTAFLLDVMRGMDDNFKEKIIIKYGEELDDSIIAKIMATMTAELKFKIIEEHMAEFAGWTLCEIFRYESDKIKVKAIEKYLEKFTVNQILIIAENMELETKEQIIEKYSEKIGTAGIQFLIKSGWNNYKWCKECIIKYKELLDGESIRHVMHDMENEQKLEIIEAVKDKLRNSDIEEMILSMNDKEKFRLLSRNKNDIKVLSAVLSTFTEFPGKENVYLNKFLQSIGTAKDDRNFIIKIMANFGSRAIPIEDINLLSSNSLNFFGKEEIYNMIKYYVFTGDKKINVDMVLTNPGLFKKYEQFRQKSSFPKQMKVMDLVDTIEEFSINKGLIEECMLGDELTKEEEKILKKCLKDKIVSIDGRHELKKFPQKRYEKIKQLIDADFDEAIVYLFTGMGKGEYDIKVKEYINISKNAMNDFDEQQDFAIIQVIDKMMRVINDMNVEKKREVLNIYNDELLNEFTDKGSYVAKLHEAFNDVEIKVRKAYGKELAETLKNDKLPLVEKQDKLDIIRLNGENFKLLIHGIDAYGKGTGKFERREVGKTYLCTSLISEDNLGRAPAGLYYGFHNIGANALVMEGSNDIFSYASDNSLNVSSKRNTEFMNINKLIETSDPRWHNELVLWREYIEEDGSMRNITPDYVVCFNMLTQVAREEATRIGVPVIVINEKAYEKTKVIRYVEEKVQNSYSEISQQMMKILQNSTKRCSALIQKDAMEKMIIEMEKEIRNTKVLEH